MVLITGLLAGIAGILSPVFTRVFTDSILSGDRTSWYPGFMYAFGGLILFQLVAAMVNQATIIRATGKIAVKAPKSVTVAIDQDARVVRCTYKGKTKTFTLK
jgi:ABC-type bacteriocin/lantibiotic exporter with double-glycine peptidase domain